MVVGFAGIADAAGASADAFAAAASQPRRALVELAGAILGHVSDTGGRLQDAAVSADDALWMAPQMKIFAVDLAGCLVGELARGSGKFWFGALARLAIVEVASHHWAAFDRSRARFVGR